MKALLLAAGLGTRLRPLTYHCAKAALPLLNLPFIHYPLQYLLSSGIRQTVINLHAHPQSVRDAAGDSFQGMPLKYSHEPEILGTAGAIRKASRLLEGDFFVVLNCDVLLNVPLQNVIDQHRQNGADVTMVIMDSEKFPGYGGLYFETEENKPPVLSGIGQGKGKKHHFTGLQVVSSRIISAIPENRKSEIFTDIYPRFIPQKKIHGFVYEDFWYETGSLKEYLETNLRLLRRHLPPGLMPPGVRDEIISGEAVVEEGATVIDSVIMSGAHIYSSAVVRQSIVGWGVPVRGKVIGQAVVKEYDPCPIP